jgi:hypothetical protein
MATVRIQLRRGTSSQWDTANPTLAAGEIGIETDTNTFKFGDGVTAWNSLDYALSNTVDDYIPLSLKGANNGVAELDGSGKIPYSQIPSIDELSQDAVNTALVAGTGITKTYNDGANTITVAVDTSVIATKAELAEVAQDSVNDSLVAGSGLQKTYDDVNNLITLEISSAVATVTGAQNLTNKTLTSPVIENGATLKGGLSFEGSTNDDYETSLVVVDPTTDNTISIPNSSGTMALTSDLTPYALLSGATFTGAVNGTDLTLSGNLTVNGTTTNINTTNLTVEDKNVILGDTLSPSNATADGGGISLKGDTDKYIQWSLSDDAWVSSEDFELPVGKSYKIDGDVVLTSSEVLGKSLPSGLIVGTNDVQELTNKTIDLTSNTLTGTVAEFNAALQDESFATLSGAETLTNKTLSSPVINGPTGLNKTDVGLSNVDNVADLDKPISTATQSALDLKAPLSGPSFTGTVSLPSTTSIGNVSSSEIATLDGVTSAIQTQIDTKAPSASPTFTGTVSLPSDTSIGNVSSSEIETLNGVTSAIQTQLDARLEATLAASTYAPIESPTFTGTVSGITKSMVGLANVDNTADSAKPISAATQTALDLKAPLSGPTFTGTVTLPSTTSVGNVSATEIGYLDGVTSAVQTQLDAKLASATAASTYAPIASPTFTGTVSGVTKAMVGLGNVDNTSDANKPVSTATQTALDAKLSLAGGTMTGALTLSGAPTLDAHAATKAYVDNVSAGINFHQPVRVATTGNITLSGTQTIDGVAVVAGDRVLVKDQTDQKTNGIYVVASGAWTRAADADNTPSGELAGGDFSLVLEGTVNSGYGYVCSNTSAITIGTTNVTYAAFNAAKAVSAGSGLTESVPGTIDIATGGVTSAMIADGTIVAGDIADGTITSAKIADGTIVNADINASAAIDWTKLAVSSTVSATELGYLDGVTSAVQTQLDAKLASATAASTYAPIASPTFTGTVTVAASGVAFTDGTQTKEGVPSRTTVYGAATGAQQSAITANATLSTLGYRDAMIEVNSSSDVTLTIPLNSATAFPVGTSIDVVRVGTGNVIIAGSAGVTINATPQNATNQAKLRSQWSSATLLKRGTDSWIVMGDLTV